MANTVAYFATATCDDRAQLQFQAAAASNRRIFIQIQAQEASTAEQVHVSADFEADPALLRQIEQRNQQRSAQEALRAGAPDGGTLGNPGGGDPGGHGQQVQQACVPAGGYPREASEQCRPGFRAGQRPCMQQIAQQGMGFTAYFCVPE